MNMNKTRGFLTLVVMSVLATPVMATPTFSVDFQGPTAGGPWQFTGLPDFFAGTPIDEGSILTAGPPGPVGPNSPLFFAPVPAVPGRV